MRPLVGHTKDVRSVAFLEDGRLLSGSTDRTVRIWDPAAGECVQTIRAPGVVYAVAAIGKRYAYAGRFKKPGGTANSVRLVLSDGTAVECEWDMPDDVRSIWSLSFSADQAFLAAACRRMGGANIPNGGGAYWWRFAHIDLYGPLPTPDAYAVAFAPVGYDLAVTRQSVVTLVDVPSGQERLRYPLQCSWAAGVTFTPGGETLVIAASSYLHFVDTTSGGADRLKTGFRSTSALAVSPDGKTLLVGGKPGAVECYDLESRQLRRALDFDVGGVSSLAFAPDGCTFAVAGETGLLLCDTE